MFFFYFCFFLAKNLLKSLKKHKKPRIKTIRSASSEIDCHFMRHKIFEIPLY